MMTKNLTVIILVYNGEKFIKNCLSSLVNQTLKNINIIIIDDGSSDNLKNELNNYSSLNIQYYKSTKNRGVSYSRNKGIKLANTKYITFIDSDDWIDLSTYEKCLKNINEDVDIINFGVKFDKLVDYNSDTWYSYPKELEVDGETALKLYTETLKNEILVAPMVYNKIYKLDFLLKNHINFYERVRYQEDDIFTFICLTQADKVKFIPNCYYHYFQRADSVIHKSSKNSIDDFFKAFSYLKQYLIRHNLFEKYKDEYYLRLKTSMFGALKRIPDNVSDKIQVKELCSYFLKKINYNINLIEFLDYINIREFLKLL